MIRVYMEGLFGLMGLVNLILDCIIVSEICLL